MLRTDRNLRALLGIIVIAGATYQSKAQIATSATITGISTQVTSVASPTVTSVFGGGSSGFPTGTNYTLSYSGERLALTSFTTGIGSGATTYEPLAYGGIVTTNLVRSNAGQTNDIIYQRVTASSGTSFTLAGANESSQQDVFNTNNLNVGTDNLFANTGDGNGNNNNIERVDVVFSDGLEVTPALAFLVLERGGTNIHDGFSIAAILSMTAGVPTFGPRVGFAANNYGNTDLVSNTADWLVIRNQLDSPGFGALNPSANIQNQAIGGTTISVAGLTSDLGLGIGLGQTIYGYSLFGYDVTAQGSDLQDVNNPLFFPTDTSSGTGAGGIDLIAYTGVAVLAIPEPGTASLVILTIGAVMTVSRRRVS